MLNDDVTLAGRLAYGGRGRFSRSPCKTLRTRHAAPPAPAVRQARRRRVALFVGLGLLAAGCTSRTARVPRKTTDTVIPQQGHTTALLLNGGGRPDINYGSHLQHVKGMVELLQSEGVRREDIVVFSGDGADPADDLATRERATEPDAWLIPQGYANILFPIVFVNSTVDGFTLRPARKDALRAWFTED